MTHVGAAAPIETNARARNASPFSTTSTTKTRPDDGPGLGRAGRGRARRRKRRRGAREARATTRSSSRSTAISRPCARAWSSSTPTARSTSASRSPATRASRARYRCCSSSSACPSPARRPEVLSFALRKDRVKQRLEAAGIPTPAGRVLTRPGRRLRPSLPAHREAGPRRRLGRHLADERRPRRRASWRAPSRRWSTTLPPAVPRRAVHRRPRVQRRAPRPPDAARPAAQRDRLRRAPGGRAAHRVVRRQVDERLGRRPRHGARAASVAAQRDRGARSARRRRGVPRGRRARLRPGRRSALAASGVPYVVDVNPNCDLAPQRGHGAGRRRRRHRLSRPGCASSFGYALRRRRVQAQERQPTHLPAARSIATGVDRYNFGHDARGGDPHSAEPRGARRDEARLPPRSRGRLGRDHHPRRGRVRASDAEAIVDAVAARAEELFPGSPRPSRSSTDVRLKRVITEVFGSGD